MKDNHDFIKWLDAQIEITKMLQDEDDQKALSAIRRKDWIQARMYEDLVTLWQGKQIAFEQARKEIDNITPPW